MKTKSVWGCRWSAEKRDG